MKPAERFDFSAFETIAEEKSDEEDQDPTSPSQQEKSDPAPSQDANREPPYQQSPVAEAAQRELRTHELLALLSCFLFPAVGACLLHAIRGQLSRPSEGLVSNYNLTVFLLASEIRPVSHLVKMIQARTLFLQKAVTGFANGDDQRLDYGHLMDLVNRIEEIEAHIADSVETSGKSAALATDLNATKVTAQTVSETRKALQPDVDALNRAVRRYEKRTTISSLQTEARLQDLESRLKDVVVLAAAAQRNAENRPKNFFFILLNWMCAIIVLPVQSLWFVVRLPARAVQEAAVLIPKSLRLMPDKAHRQVRYPNQVKARDRRSKTGS